MLFRSPNMQLFELDRDPSGLYVANQMRIEPADAPSFFPLVKTFVLWLKTNSARTALTGLLSVGSQSALYVGISGVLVVIPGSATNPGIGFSVIVNSKGTHPASPVTGCFGKYCMMSLPASVLAYLTYIL